MFDHEGPAVVSAMHDLTSGVLEHSEINCHMEVEERIAYMQRILRGAEL